MKLTVAHGWSPASRAGCARLTPFLRRLVERVPPRGGPIALNWVSDASMRRLNRAYKKRSGVPEILTFPCGGGPDPATELPVGEIYLSLAGVSRGARRRGVAKRSYAARLLVHGVFHLRGHRHDDGPGWARMERAEERFLRGFLPERDVERLFA
ncbi:MAG TPA: rRNA maturation RNase YbeY [Candidatus Bathyarchaeia archaeon]|nr:rRNA maturation RNase YbeY [Candidatus Bathyarchaeia archaeon]